MHRPSHYGAAFLSYSLFTFLLTGFGYLELPLLGALVASVQLMT